MRNGKRRSAAITLVLAGSATLAGCGSPVEQRDAYASQGDCVRDWTDISLCEPVRDGHYASSYHYGPPYYSSGWNLFGSRMAPSPNAMDVKRLPTGSVAASPFSARATRLGLSGGGSSGVSRGGFGSSSHSSFSSGG